MGHCEVYLATDCENTLRFTTRHKLVTFNRRPRDGHRRTEYLLDTTWMKTTAIRMRNTSGGGVDVHLGVFSIVKIWSL